MDSFIIKTTVENDRGDKGIDTLMGRALVARHKGDWVLSGAGRLQRYGQSVSIEVIIRHAAAAALKEANDGTDGYLTNLVHTMRVELMPGEGDYSKCAVGSWSYGAEGYPLPGDQCRELADRISRDL